MHHGYSGALRIYCLVSAVRGALARGGKSAYLLLQRCPHSVPSRCSRTGPRVGASVLSFLGSILESRVHTALVTKGPIEEKVS